MINEKKYISEIKKAKIKLKKELIKLSFYEKIQRVVQMQKMMAKMQRNKNKKIYVWKI